MNTSIMNQNIIDAILAVGGIPPCPSPLTHGEAVSFETYPYSESFPRYWVIKIGDKLIAHDYLTNHDLFWVPEPISLTLADILAFQHQWQDIRKDIGHEDMFARMDKEIEEIREQNKDKEMTYDEWRCFEDEYLRTKNTIYEEKTKTNELRTYNGTVVVQLYDKYENPWDMQVIIPDKKRLLPQWENGGYFYIIRKKWYLTYRTAEEQVLSSELIP